MRMRGRGGGARASTDNIYLDDLTKAPMFHVTFGGDRSVTTTKEFIFHQDDVDFASIPVSPEQLQQFSKAAAQRQHKQQRNSSENGSSGNSTT